MAQGHQSREGGKSVAVRVMAQEVCRECASARNFCLTKTWTMKISIDNENSEVGKTHEVQSLGKGLQATTDWREEEPAFPKDEALNSLPNTK